MTFRIGHGFDVHAFTEGSYLTVGGIKIEYHQSFAAHSDGDVLLHAICDALLGAAALGDIGQHFPDTDPAFAGADSSFLLAHCLGLVKAKGYKVGNVDATIVAQAPKMSPHIGAMKSKIADVLDVNSDAVNIKATTTEKLGFTGRKEGISAHAVILLIAE